LILVSAIWRLKPRLLSLQLAVGLRRRVASGRNENHRPFSSKATILKNLISFFGMAQNPAGVSLTLS
jgi:hypothetical protein